MAILKHTSSKNMSYCDALCYLKYKHNEDSGTGHYEPILDTFGLLQERDNYALSYLDGYGREHDPDDWVAACTTTNLTYHKNNTRGERKQHIYVISHPAEDTPLLTKESLLEEGKAFVRENLPGYDALIAVHMDTDHYHVHISINSIRSVAREEQPWMTKDENGNVLQCELKAGCKHQDNPEFRRHCQQWLTDYTRSHGYTVKDNLAIEDERKETRACEKYAKLKAVILSCAAKSASYQELCSKLQNDHGIFLVRRGKTFTVHPPNSKKGIRLKTLGLSEADLPPAAKEERPSGQPALKADFSPVEKKKYVQWLIQRRVKNNIRAEDTLADAASLITAASEKYHRKEDFRELHDLIRQAVYVQRDLQIELEKIDALLDRWHQYLDPALSEQERSDHGRFVQWCGCDPASDMALHSLELERDAVFLQIQEAGAVQEALLQSADQWSSENDDKKFTFHQQWVTSREDQLKQQLKSVRANRKHLEQIAYNCQMAAGRRIYKQEYLAKAACFRKLWHEKLSQEKILRAKLKEIEAENRKAKRNSKKKDLGR